MKVLKQKLTETLAAIKSEKQKKERLIKLKEDIRLCFNYVIEMFIRINVNIGLESF